MEKKTGPIRVYADTSVFGGAFDEEFEKASKAFFDQVREGRFLLIVSDLIRIEIEDAPPKVRELFESLLPISETVVEDEKAVDLRDAYLDSGVVGPGTLADALHVANASVSRSEVIVSWNFKHIVHMEKIPLYNEVNRKNGFQKIRIHTPQEVIEYENENL